MNRIDATFARLREKGQTAFVAYIGAGDPDLETTLKIARAMDEWGVDILELGVPFSDPMADGIVNQLAAERALAAGTTVEGVLQLVRDLRKETDMAVVLYNYMNPIYTYGFGRFLEDAADAGVDGLLLLDLPPEEQAANEELASIDALKLIRLIAPTTPEDRIERVAKLGEGFIYYVSREGVTGEREDVAEGLEEQVARIRAAASVPVVVGFGIAKPEQARAVAAVSDGVVVGSAIVRQIAEHGTSPDLLARLKQTVVPLIEATKA